MNILKVDRYIGSGRCVQTCPTDVLRFDPQTGKAYGYQEIHTTFQPQIQNYPLPDNTSIQVCCRR